MARHTLLFFPLGVFVLSCNWATPPGTVATQLQELRSSESGAADLHVDNAIVTYVVPNYGPDSSIEAGFFMQSTPSGPGVFIPTKGNEDVLKPYPERGDVVRLHVSKSAGGPAYTAQLPPGDDSSSEGLGIAEFRIMEQGAAYEALTHDFDYTEHQEGAVYRDQLVSLSVLLDSRMTPMGPEHYQVQIKPARNSFSESIYLAAPRQVVEQMNIQRGCQLRVNNVPIIGDSDAPYILVSQEAEILLAVCENPMTALQNAPLAKNVPKETGEILFTELMTHSVQSHGQSHEWFELLNTSETPMNLRGCILRRPAPKTDHVIGEDVFVGPGEYVVFSNNERPSQVHPDYVYYTSYSILDDSGNSRLALTCGEQLIDMVDFQARRLVGQSLALDPKKLSTQANDKRSGWCWSPLPISESHPDWDKATPGRENSPCGKNK